MFKGEVRKTDEESGHLRNGKNFRSSKRRSTTTRIEGCIMIVLRDYESFPLLDEESCEEEEYRLVLKEEEDQGLHQT